MNPREMTDAEARAFENSISQPLRNHLTDGHWHDDCPYCRRRRGEGGTGVTQETGK